MRDAGRHDCLLGFDEQRHHQLGGTSNCTSPEWTCCAGNEGLRRRLVHVLVDGGGGIRVTHMQVLARGTGSDSSLWPKIVYVWVSRTWKGIDHCTLADGGCTSTPLERAAFTARSIMLAADCGTIGRNERIVAVNSCCERVGGSNRACPFAMASTFPRDASENLGHVLITRIGYAVDERQRAFQAIRVQRSVGTIGRRSQTRCSRSCVSVVLLNFHSSGEAEIDHGNKIVPLEDRVDAENAEHIRRKRQTFARCAVGAAYPGVRSSDGSLPSSP